MPYSPPPALRTHDDNGFPLARVWLRMEYTTGPEAGTHDHVGPFASTISAAEHKGLYGPYEASIVVLRGRPEPFMFPAQHVSHVTRRA